MREYDEERARRQAVLGTAVAVSRAVNLALGGKEAAGDWKAWTADLVKEP